MEKHGVTRAPDLVRWRHVILPSNPPTQLLEVRHRSILVAAWYQFSATEESQLVVGCATFCPHPMVVPVRFCNKTASRHIRVAKYWLAARQRPTRNGPFIKEATNHSCRLQAECEDIGRSA